MNQNLSWIEADSWQGLLQQAGIGRQAVRRPRREATLETELLVASDSTADSEPRDLESGLRQLASSVVSRSGASAAFVTDDSGLEIVSQGADSSVIAASGQTLRHLQQVASLLDSNEAGKAVIRLDGNRRLHVVEVTTNTDTYALGIVHHRELTDSELTTYGNELDQLLGREGRKK